MLSKAQSIVAFKNNQRIPDCLTTRTHRDYPERIERAIAVYATGVGKRRKELESAVDEIFDDDPNYHERRPRAFCELLDDFATYNSGKSSVALRTKVFSMAAEKFPLVSEPQGLFGSARSEMTVAIEAKLERPWSEIEEELFNDVKSFQRLTAFDCPLSPRDLIRRYNLRQAQACLYEALKVTVTATTDFRGILKYAKLARLMHSIVSLPNGSYRFEFEGPASVHRQTSIYGARMARMVPGLLSCTGWTLTATFKKNGWPSTYSLDPESGLTTEVVPSEEYDSDLESDFAEKWNEKTWSGWSLSRGTEILHEGQTVYFPDFHLNHEDRRKVHLEIVGFWTPEYLQKKRQTLDLFQKSHRILVAVAESKAEQFSDLGYPVVRFANKLSPSAILRALEENFSAM